MKNLKLIYVLSLMTIFVLINISCETEEVFNADETVREYDASIDKTNSITSRQRTENAISALLYASTSSEYNRLPSSRLAQVELGLTFQKLYFFNKINLNSYIKGCKKKWVGYRKRGQNHCNKKFKNNSKKKASCRKDYTNIAENQKRKTCRQ